MDITNQQREQITKLCLDLYQKTGIKTPVIEILKDPITNSVLLEMYVLKNKSPDQIKKEVNLGITTRSMQRKLKKMGYIRSLKDAFNLAIKEGRMKYYRLSEEEKQKRKTVQADQRLRILTRDQFRCKICGADRDNCLRLEVDHIDENPSNNEDENLRTLCDLCNKGKSVIAGKYKWKRNQIRS